jgi:hypothetical protein
MTSKRASESPQWRWPVHGLIAPQAEDTSRGLIVPAQPDAEVLLGVSCFKMIAIRAERVTVVATRPAALHPHERALTLREEAEPKPPCAGNLLWHIQRTFRSR